MKDLNVIYFTARGLSPEDRPAYLAEACQGDPSLRARVEQMLAVSEEAEAFIADVPDDAHKTIKVNPNDSPDESIGQTIGRYKILEKIGEGGCGVVYVAEQTEPVRRRVALKVIKLGMDTKQVVARFEAERQALAMMDHPNIARVLDAGSTETGRPYFVMELVRGIRITDYCDNNNLATKERLDLFSLVCHAIQHAHQKGVIHRDIKPSNILVTLQDGAPAPKVIDFGIAKATEGRLTDATVNTQLHQFIGTPAYMSPEQAEMTGLDVDTRSDIYSLGVLLYELLTGKTPFSAQDLLSQGIDAMRKTIREQEPVRPSTKLGALQRDELTTTAKRRSVEPVKLTRLLQGDLDWIVMKCLEKDRTRRYETANGMAMDIQRYFQGQPVLATPPSAGYRLRKFARRNRGQVIVGGVLAAALALGMIGTGLALKRALRAESGLHRQLVETEKAHEAEKARADELKEVSDFQAKMLAQVDVTTAGVKLTEDVNRRFADALADTPMSDAERSRATNSFRVEWSKINAIDAARTLINETILKPAVKAVDGQFKDQPLVDAQLREALAERYRDLSMEDSVPLQRRTLEIRQRLLGKENPETLYSLNNLCTLLIFYLPKHDEAEPLVREGLATSRRVLGEEHPTTLAFMDQMGVVLRAQSKTNGPAAESCLRELVEKSRRALGEDDPRTLKYINRLAGVLEADGKFTEAEPLYRETIEKSRRVLGEDARETQRDINSLGCLFEDQGKSAEAEPYLREALEKARRTLGEDDMDTRDYLHNLGAVLRDQGKFAEAEPYIRNEMEWRRRWEGEKHRNTLTTMNILGAVMVKEGKNQEVIHLLEPSEGLERKIFTGRDERRLALFLSDLGRARVGLGYDDGRLALAETNLLEAYPILLQSAGETNKAVMDCAQGLVDLYTVWDKAEPGKGHDAKAAAWRKRVNPQTMKEASK